MKCKIVRHQKLMWRNIMKSIKSQKKFQFYIIVYIYIYILKRPTFCQRLKLVLSY